MVHALRTSAPTRAAAPWWLLLGAQEVVLVMRAYAEDLRKKVVEAVERGMKKSEAAYTFGLSLSSVKRYIGAVGRASGFRSTITT